MHKHSFYPSRFPVAGEIVVIKITKITDLGVYVQLLEYNGIEGLIVVGELSKKKIKSVASLVKIGRIEVAMVLRVDNEKGYIDLSRKKVSMTDYQTCIKRYNQNKLAHSVLIVEAKNKDKCVDTLYEEYFAKAGNSSLYNYFLKVLSNETQDEILDSVKKKYNLARYKVRADVEVTSHNVGVEAVKNALMRGKNVDKRIDVALIKTPIYSVMMTVGDKDEGINLINEAVSIIRNDIEESGGKFNMAGGVEVIGEKGNIDLLCDKIDNLTYSSSEENED
ncbi:hypothetical protein COBT_003075 [Conglomerata obtusa]